MVKVVGLCLSDDGMITVYSLLVRSPPSVNCKTAGQLYNITLSSLQTARHRRLEILLHVDKIIQALHHVDSV